MRNAVRTLVCLALFGCDDGGDPAVQTDAMIGQGGDGGQGGGTGGAGAGGTGGEGGVGGAGGAGQGGAGGQGGDGGQGGAGGQGGDGGGDPNQCDPECPLGSECVAGECQFVGCPDGFFDCDGVCVDLLADPDHCGSCGHACIDEWSADAPPLDALGAVPACADAQCAFVCPDTPDISVSDLRDDPDNCGVCGATCGGELVTGGEAMCADFECSCRLQGATGAFAGNVCGDACTIKGENCQGGCCPTLDMGVTDGMGTDRSEHAFVFEVDAPTNFQVDLTADDCGQMQLVRYYQSGFVQVVATSTNCRIDDAPLIAGRYGLTLFLRDAGPYRLTRTAPDLEPLLTAPGRVEQADTDATLAFPFRVEADSGFWMRMRKVRGNDCGGRWSSALYAADGHQIFGDEGTRCNRFDENHAPI